MLVRLCSVYALYMAWVNDARMWCATRHLTHCDRSCIDTNDVCQWIVSLMSVHRDPTHTTVTTRYTSLGKWNRSDSSQARVTIRRWWKIHIHIYNWINDSLQIAFGYDLWILCVCVILRFLAHRMYASLIAWYLSQMRTFLKIWSKSHSHAVTMLSTHAFERMWQADFINFIEPAQHNIAAIDLTIGLAISVKTCTFWHASHKSTIKHE